MQRPIAILFSRFGPYHYARVRAAATRAPIVGIEVTRKDRTYQWDVVAHVSGLRCTTLFPNYDGMPSAVAVVKALWRHLERETPKAVAIPGWSTPEALGALQWAVKRGVPTVLMCESQARDSRRWSLKEVAKTRIVSLFGAALVGGKHHREYVASLGMRADRIFTGYDVVDNDHFSRGADAARLCYLPSVGPALARPYFLASCRFVAKKNVGRLLESYRRYRQRACSEPWDLTVLGDGPLASLVRTDVARLGIEAFVRLPGFRQYHELPPYYGLARAFVHASTTEQWGLVVNEAMAAGLPLLVSNTCGCAHDLVCDGVNGFTFDPYDVDTLTDLMLRVSTMSNGELRAMGAASREIIRCWTPETFAQNLLRAVDAVALTPPGPMPTVLDRALLWALIRRAHLPE